MAQQISYAPQKMIRGSTPLIKVYFQTDVAISDLGTPSIAISQDLVLLQPDVSLASDENGPFLYCTLTEEESLLLTAGLSAQVQVTWANGNQVIKGGMHKMMVEATLIEEAGE